jgi:hypothetical protein
MKPLWLMGGLALGAGLMYMLDPEKGGQRRDLARGQLATYGRHTEDFLDDTSRTLGQQVQALLARARMPMRHQPGRGERLLAQAEQFGVTKGLLMLGCVGLGVGLTYMLEPEAGPKRRTLMRDIARTYWHKTDHLLRSAGREVSHNPPQLQGRNVHATQEN